MSVPYVSQLPWCRGDAVRLGVGVAAGALVSALAWSAAADRATEADQTGPATVAVVGLLIAFASQVAWFLQGRRVVGDRARHLLGSGVRPAQAQPLTVGEDAEILVAGEGLERYHRATCPLAAPQEWPAASRATHEAAGRRPCGVCRP